MTHPSGTLAAADRKPRDDEIDVFGLTHPGRVRAENQDHFLICSLHKAIAVHGTSLPAFAALPSADDRVAFLAMVADGVGGGTRGEEASRHAVELVSRYVTGSMQCYYAANTADDGEFIAALQQAATECHEEFLRRADAARSRYATTLSSAIGGRQNAPVVTRVENGWGYVHLLCSDGLTRHVSDERIQARLAAMTSARQLCQDLLQDALDGGGSDNITIIAGRSVRSDRP
jgi:serine/threonine protein phosphatase PrpC